MLFCSILALITFRWRSIMFLVLFCFISVEILEIQLVCDLRLTAKWGSHKIFTVFFHQKTQFLDGFSHLYERVCPSVRPSVRPSVGRSHTSWISDISTEMKQNSTKNMMLRHLKVIKAKIEQKSIHIMKLPFEGPFKNKYAGRSPERILCLYSVRLVFL